MGNNQYSQMDIDSSWILQALNVKKRMPENVLKVDQDKINQEITSKNWSQVGRYLTKPNETIFYEGWDSQVEHVLRQLLSLPLKNLLKRFNLIYYNNNDMEDILVMTVPADPDFAIHNVSELVQRISMTVEGYFLVTPGYLDILSKSNQLQPLLAQRTKLVYDNYTVLFDLQVLPASPAKSMSFEVFQPNVDHHIIVYDPSYTQITITSGSAPLSP